jgi:hypothetical protein
MAKIIFRKHWFLFVLNDWTCEEVALNKDIEIIQESKAQLNIPSKINQTLESAEGVLLDQIMCLRSSIELKAQSGSR